MEFQVAGYRGSPEFPVVGAGVGVEFAFQPVGADSLGQVAGDAAGGIRLAAGDIKTGVVFFQSVQVIIYGVKGAVVIAAAHSTDGREQVRMGTADDDGGESTGGKPVDGPVLPAADGAEFRVDVAYQVLEYIIGEHAVALEEFAVLPGHDDNHLADLAVFNKPVHSVVQETPVNPGVFPVQQAVHKIDGAVTFVFVKIGGRQVNGITPSLVDRGGEEIKMIDVTPPYPVEKDGILRSVGSAVFHHIVEIRIPPSVGDELVGIFADGYAGGRCPPAFLESFHLNSRRFPAV